MDEQRVAARMAYGDTLCKLEKYGVAAKFYKQAVRILIETRGEEDPETAAADRKRNAAWSLYKAVAKRNAAEHEAKMKATTDRLSGGGRLPSPDGRPTSRGNLLVQEGTRKNLHAW